MSVARHDKLAAWFVGWWLADWLAIRLIGWLTGGLAHGLVSRMADHPNDGLHPAGRLADSVASRRDG